MKIIDSRIVDSGFENFNGLGILKLNLGYAAMRTLSSRTRRECVYDYSLGRRVDRGTMLAIALALKEYIQKILRSTTGSESPCRHACPESP